LAKKVVTVPDVNRRDIVSNLADHMEARMAELGIDSVSELAKMAGVSREGLVPLVRGIRKQYQRRLTRPVCDALGWSRDSITRLLDGKEPALATPSDPSEVSPLDDLTAEVAELRQAVSELQALTDPAMEWLAAVAAEVGVAMPARLRSVL
jgi:hypothetical protein